MDVGLRAVSVIVSASILSQENKEFDAAFSEYKRMLYSHMLFIRDNMEYGLVRENHYLTDIVGLKMISQCFCDSKKGKKNYKFSSKSFRQEIKYQICPDGVDHEASTCYHGYVLELLMVGLSTDPELQKRISRKEYDRLANMADYTDRLCSFDRYPIVGDNDSGRVLDLNGSGSFRKEVCSFSKYFLGLTDKKSSEYCFLTKTNSIKVFDRKKPESKILECHDGGFALLNSDDYKLLVHAGSIGRKGKGGHGHNDQTSLILDIKGHSVILDPGSVVYERDLELRHKYRSTMIHNCLTLNDTEQNNISIKRPFKMDNNTKAFFRVDYEDGQQIITACHYGYYDSFNTICQRSICAKDSSIMIEDEIKGGFLGKFTKKYMISPELSCEIKERIVHLYHEGKFLCEIEFSSEVEVSLEDDLYSPDYGVTVKTKAVCVSGMKNDSENKKILTRIQF